MPIEDYYVKAVAVRESGTQELVGWKMYVKHSRIGILEEALARRPIFRTESEAVTAYENAKPEPFTASLAPPSVLPNHEVLEAFKSLYRAQSFV